MSATLADIAKATETSISTVSRVLTGAPAARRISKETRERISKAAVEMGYRPNLLARSLRTRRTWTIAVMVSDIANPWFGQLAGLIEQNLHRRGYSLIVCNSGEDATLEAEYLRLLPQKGIDGLIIVPLASEKGSLTEHLPAGLPLVVIDRPVAGVPACIASDQRQATAILCDELARKGVKKVALIHGPSHVITHRQRSEAVRAKFEVVADYEGPAQRETGRSAWGVIEQARPDAIICTNNFLGQGVIEKMAEGRWQAPVACFDEIPLVELLPVPVVCSVQDVPSLAEGAVEMLLNQIAGVPASARTLTAKIVTNRAFARV